MQVVTFSTASGLVSELLLPMRLIAYNGGSRRLVIGGETRTLPAPIVAWLQGSSQYGWLIVAVADGHNRSDGIDEHRPQ